MIPEDRIDKMVALASAACNTDAGLRLLSACTVDGLLTRIVGAGNPDMKDIAASMTTSAIVDAAEREFEELDEGERDKLTDTVEHIQTRMVAAVKHSWTVAAALGYDPEEVLTPEGIAFFAAVLTIPPDTPVRVDDAA